MRACVASLTVASSCPKARKTHLVEGLQGLAGFAAGLLHLLLLGQLPGGNTAAGWGCCCQGNPSMRLRPCQQSTIDLGEQHAA
jgi:hypothetical protein